MGVFPCPIEKSGHWAAQSNLCASAGRLRGAIARQARTAKWASIFSLTTTTWHRPPAPPILTVKAWLQFLLRTPSEQRRVNFLTRAGCPHNAKGFERLADRRLRRPAWSATCVASFGETLEALATSDGNAGAFVAPPQEIALCAYHLYEEFRPEIPAGVRGWGAAGKPDLDRIEALVEQ
jgi:hypothetical protein